MSVTTPRRVLVSGGATGVGEQLVRLLASAGHHVLFLDINVPGGSALARELTATGAQVEFLQADVSEARVAGLVTVQCERLGGIDWVFNHAGTVLVAPFLETTPEQWLRLLQINLMSMVFVSQAVLPFMIRAGQGSIVNTCSISGLSASALESVYCVTKGACIQLTRAIAVEFRDRGIRCNAVCPGFIRTPHGERELAALRAAGEPLDESGLYVLQGRICEPVEVARAAIFLASDEASFINGEMLTVDNGAMART